MSAMDERTELADAIPSQGKLGYARWEARQAVRARLPPRVAPAVGVVHAGSAFHQWRSVAQEAYDAGYAAYQETREEMFFTSSVTLRTYGQRNAEQACRERYETALAGGEESDDA